MITPVYPANVLFKFQVRRCSGLPTDPLPSVYTITQTVPYGGMTYGTEVFDESCVALFTFSDSSTIPTNQAVLNDLTLQFTRDYYAWKKTQLDIVLAGIANVAMNGIYQCVEFDYNQDKCFTRISSLPDQFQPYKLAHQLPNLQTLCPDTDDTNAAIPCVKRYGQPSSSTGLITTFDEYLICFQDGRLVSTFLQTVTYNCGCKPSNECCSIVCGNIDIPKQNLTLTWTNPITGNGSTTLYFNGISWVSSCTNGLTFILLCTNNSIEFRAIYYTTGSCPTGTQQYCSNIRTSPYGFTGPLNINLNPLSLTFNSQSSGCPAITSAGYTQFVVTGPLMSPPQDQCCITICIPNCVPASYSVNISGSGGTIASGTITTTGTLTANSCITLNIGSPGFYTITVEGNGINYSQQQSMVCCETIFLPFFCAYFYSAGCHNLRTDGYVDATITINGNTYSLPATICFDASQTSSWPWTASTPGFTDQSGTWSFSSPLAFPCDQCKK